MKKEIEQKLRQALRWPEKLDLLSHDGDSRSSMERAVAAMEEMLADTRQRVLREALESLPRTGVVNPMNEGRAAIQRLMKK